MTGIKTEHGELPLYVATPAGAGPWPGVVVVHDVVSGAPDYEKFVRRTTRLIPLHPAHPDSPGTP